MSLHNLLEYVKRHPSIEVLVVGNSWNALKIFSNTFPDLPSCVLSQLHNYEFKGNDQLIVFNGEIASHLFLSPTRHETEHAQFLAALRDKPQFNTVVVFSNPTTTAVCLGAIEGRAAIEQIFDCPIAQNTTVPSAWKPMVDNYANQMQQHRLNEVLEHEVGQVPNTKKKM